MKVLKSTVYYPIDDVIKGENVIKSTKVYKDAKSFYLNDGCLDEETGMYDVYSYTPDTTCKASLNWGLTVLYPLTVDGECNMTRGHWHENRECTEIYYGISGKGLLMLMDEEGNTWAEEVCEGSLHHIDGHFAHRLINTGEEVMKVAACWGKEAGHDYAAVEAMPFGYRVFKDKNGKLLFKEVKR